MRTPATPNHHTSLRVAVLAVLLAVAGCTAPSIDASDANRPPGVSENRVVPEPILAAHSSALANTSHTVRFEYHGPIETNTGVLRIDAERNRALLLVEHRSADGVERVTVYVAPATVYIREQHGDDPTEYRVLDREPWIIRHLREDLGMFGATVEALRNAKLEPRGTVGHQGRTLTVLSGNGTFGPYFHEYQPIQARLLVSERGVVYRAEYRGQNPETRSTWRLSKVGQTRVSRPAWVETAENRRGLVRPWNSEPVGAGVG